MNKLPVFILILCSLVSQTAFAQGKSHSDPADLGVTVKSIIQIGSVQTSNYDVAVTVLETVRGDAALKRIRSSSQNAPAPSAGLEYWLAKVRFALQGRAVSDTGSFELARSPFQWVVYSSSFNQYDSVTVAAPEPVLQGDIKSGEVKEGWLVFEVEQEEDMPMLMFNPSTGGAEGRGKTLFFKLY